MDEYLVSSDAKNRAKQDRYQDTYVGLQALAEATMSMQKLAFREVLTVDETLPSVETASIEDSSSVHQLFRQTEKIDSITEFQQPHDLAAFDETLAQHRLTTMSKPILKPSEMTYLKLCLLLELRRDEGESCLRIFLHDIIFKYHLADFHLRCEIHLRKPIEDELVLEKYVHDSHLETNYSAEFVLSSGDWIVQQEVEFYIVMKIESLAISKYYSARFWDMAHLHVKNVPHGASRIFLREMTPVYRPHKIVSLDHTLVRSAMEFFLN